jgi:hypothetical protein
MSSQFYFKNIVRKKNNIVNFFSKGRLVGVFDILMVIHSISVLTKDACAMG